MIVFFFYKWHKFGNPRGSGAHLLRNTELDFLSAQPIMLNTCEVLNDEKEVRDKQKVKWH